ncbi:MAG: peptidoglycan DD-metalloendopeptidase family protein, partial [Bacteroidota bacterium]
HRLAETIFQDEREIYRLKKELDTLKIQYAQSIVFAYKNRSNYGYLNFLFSASSFDDAIKRIAYLKSYRQFRETQAQTIVKTQNLLQHHSEDLSLNRKDMSAALQLQNNQKKELEQDKKDKDLAVKQLKDQEKTISAQLKKREKQRQELNKAIDAAIRKEIAEAEKREKLARQKAAEEKKRQDAAAKAQAANEPKKTPANGTATKPATVPEPTSKGVATTNNSNRTYSSLESTPEGLTESIELEKRKGRLPWPVSTGDIIHHFGKEVINQQMIINNDGIVISTPIGTSVKSVADGEVISVMDLSEYLAVLVRHGKYFITYNGLSSTNVTKGQKVNAGTIVGKAAADFSGGGAVEFRIMDSHGNYFNPESWLKSR